MNRPAIDNGRIVDWGKTSKDYSKYRDIYPEEFYQKLRFFGIGLPGQKILDLGTGTGVIPRALSKYGAEFTGTDLSEEQISAAIRLSKDQDFDIEWKVCPAEETGMPDKSFDIVTACQCWWYFDKTKVIPEIKRVLKPDGKLALLFMNWLPFENKVAGITEELVLKYNPDWKGFGFKGNNYTLPSWLNDNFKLNTYHSFRVPVTFTRESWRGRIRSCRGIGASLSKEEVERFDSEHDRVLKQIVPEAFNVEHEAWFEIYELTGM
jgi:SAM-dependent methyltransferase